MREIRFFDIGSSDFPGDVMQCHECSALVLEVNTGAHAAWHEQMEALITKAREGVKSDA